MTVVIAIKKNNQISMAADSLLTVGDITVIKNESPKIFRKDDVLIGCCGDNSFSFFMKNIIFDFINQYKNKYFIEEWFEFCHNKSEHKNILLENQANHFVVSFEDQIYHLSSDGGGFVVGDDMWGIGSGRQFALGAAYAIYDLYDNSEDIAEKSVQSACYFNQYCARPIILETIEF